MCFICWIIPQNGFCNKHATKYPFSFSLFFVNKFYLFLALCLFQLSVLAQVNMSFLGRLDYDAQLSNVWGYAQDGREYALVGLSSGCTIVDVTDPTNPQELFFIAGQQGIWREIKTWLHYAYVTNETGGGIQIIDLSGLPSNMTYSEWTGGMFNGETISITTAHTPFIDENGILYLNGTSWIANGTRAQVLLDLTQNPTNPPIVGTYAGGYVHDCFARNDTLWNGEIYNGYFSVIDVSDKANPVVLATQTTPNSFTHNTWLSDNGQYLFTTDEKTGSFVAAYDVSNLQDIQETDRYQSSPGTGVIPHNTYVVAGNFLVTSYYKDGVTVVDANNPYNLVEVGNYDTSPLSGNGFSGAWGVYPYLPSGNLLVSDMQEGLFIIHADYARACYLSGQVSNAQTGTPLSGVLATIEGFSEQSTTTAFTGNFSTGIALEGTYTVTFELYGYYPQSVEVSFVAGETANLNIALQPIPPFAAQVRVIDPDNGLPISNAQVYLSNNDGQPEQSATTNAEGIAAFALFYENNYDLLIGKWGYETTQVLAQYLSTNTSYIEIPVERGYYDDFILDFGWQASGNATNGQFERGIPVGQELNNVWVNPSADADNDLGGMCYTTGASGGLSNNVGNGKARLTSPTFDLSNYQNPRMTYQRWFHFQDDNGAGMLSNDTMFVFVSNGTTTVLLETITNENEGESEWVEKTFLLNQYLSTGSNMHIIVEVGDAADSPHLVDAAFDLWRIQDESLPLIEIGASQTTVCVGSSVQFDNLSGGDIASVEWVLPGSTAPISTAFAPQVIYVLPGTFDVTLHVYYTDGNTQTLWLENYITVHPNPQPQIEGMFTICGNTPALLTTETTYQAYTWSNSTSGQNLTTNTPGTYCVTVVDGAGCVGSDCAVVTAGTLPNVVIMGAAQVCAGETAHLCLAFDWQSVWNTGDTTPCIDTPPIIANNEFSVTVTAANGCTNQAALSVNALPTPQFLLSDDALCGDAPDSVWVNVVAAPPFNAQVLSGNGQIVGQNNNGFYLFFENASPQLGAFSSELSLTDANTCSSVSNLTLFAEDCVLGISSSYPTLPLHLQPNPATDHVWITSPIDRPNVLVTLDVYNTSGQIVWQKKYVHLQGTFSEHISLNDWGKGLYLVQLRTDTTVWHGKLVLD